MSKKKKIASNKAVVVKPPIKKSSMFYVWKVWQLTAARWRIPGSGIFRHCDFCGVRYEIQGVASYSDKYCSRLCYHGALSGSYLDGYDLRPGPPRHKTSGDCDIYSGVKINDARCRKRDRLACCLCPHLCSEKELETDGWKRPETAEFI